MFADRPLQWFPAGLLMGMDTGSSQDVTVDHNTAFAPAGPVQANSTQNGFAFTNNIAVGNVINQGNFPGLVFARNVLLDGTASAYPPGNWFPPGTTPVVNAFSGGDYHLVPGSPYKGAGTDGLDVGANIDALNAATAGAISGGPPVSPPPPSPPPPSPPGPPPPSVSPVWTVDIAATGATVKVLKDGVVVFTGTT